jgi:hypothetical protein
MSRLRVRPGEGLRAGLVLSQGQFDRSRGTRALAWHLMVCLDPTSRVAHRTFGAVERLTALIPTGMRLK